MKKKILKNTLSLLTLGSIIFSCSKSSETEQKAKAAIQKVITSINGIVFTKAKNSTGNPATPTEAYKALFIKKTPALPYTNNLYNKFENYTIKEYGVFKVLVPFDKTLNIETAETLTATITLNGKIEPNIYLGDSTTPIDPNATSFDHVITTKLVHKDLIKSEGISHSFKLSRKEKGSDPVEKVCKLIFVHDTPSTDCSIIKFALSKGATDATGNAKMTVAGGLAVLGTKKPTGDGNTKATPVEYEIEKAAFSNIAANDVLKADAMILPDGATISTKDAGGDDQTNKDPIIDGITVAANPTDDVSIYFKVVAQDGETQKFYKFTYKNSLNTE
ncbi:hypothetical protein [Ichthyobacterium seriolicida]|uniref:Lipoprotein n=1 Tax=Ichthyobacterium seriolicida TaxID=242600 RepID=A0A1J1ECB5_9FLAO|nr:hypothetical protein [Ichthyobacterium seriolicida]BAV95152.1 hypothetical protein JBKA6_1139 [Ichthyobacterium seriolicida]